MSWGYYIYSLHDDIILTLNHEILGSNQLVDVVIEQRKLGQQYLINSRSHKIAYHLVENVRRLLSPSVIKHRKDCSVMG